MKYFDKRFEEIEKKLQQPPNKNAKIEDTFKFKHKGNSVQFEFNQQILRIVENLLLALNNDDTSEANDFCDDLTAELKRRNKLIKMADRSVLGWDTVAQCEADTIASDSDGGKKIRKADRTGHLLKGKLKHLTNLPFGFPVRNHQASSFGSTVNIMVSHPRVYETSDTETKVEGMQIDNEFSGLSNDYTIQESEFEKGNYYPSVTRKLKKNLIFWRETLSADSAILKIIDNGYKIHFFKTPKCASFRNNQSALKNKGFVEESIPKLLNFGSII